uniref:Histone-lysine N-methyltransferase, H3 lysine-79 specific n=1 Tax=Albugo laibachii Nc14 TaxID=890382 RepID=F0WYH3_9STRA|nr:conserved hypothetical protein [Albugo laibachii Nc14]|eukprot:CCA26528.1 conserved hypothetical protein [Albugo laibachii Nc14]
MTFSGFDSFENNVHVFEQQATKCSKYNPNDADWQQLLQLSTTVRKELSQLLHEPNGVQTLKDSNALNKIKNLIPVVAKAEIETMKIEDFALTIVYEQPFRVFSQVYHGFGSEYGKELSIQAREAANITEASYVGIALLQGYKNTRQFCISQIYGEIDFFPFADVLQWVIQQGTLLENEAVFYDLGSGTGKAVLAASLLYNFNKVIGIEALESLNTFAKKRAAKLKDLAKSHCIVSSIEFWHGSFLETDWTDGTVVFCHGTCFSDSEWTSISLAAEKLKQGSYVITASQILKSALFEVIKSERIKASWGMANIYIHRRRKIGRWASKILRGGRASRLDWQPETKAAFPV